MKKAYYQKKQKNIKGYMEFVKMRNNKFKTIMKGKKHCGKIRQNFQKINHSSIKMTYQTQ